MRDLSIAEQCIPRKCKDDLVSRRQVYKLKLASDNDWEFGQALMDMPSAEPEPCEDTISRSEAIKVIEAVPDGNWKSTRYSKEIRRLPSVQPEIIRCKDCIKRETCRMTNI